MNLSIPQDQKRFDTGLIVNLLSFSLPKSLIKKNEEIRVSITTTPEKRKQHFHIKGKNMNSPNHAFKLNINNETKRIVVIFRKRTILPYNPVIASTTIHLSEFTDMPKESIASSKIDSDIKILNIYYPLQKQINHQNNCQLQNQKTNRKVLGQMQVQLSFAPPFANFYDGKSTQDYEKDNNKRELKKKSRKNIKWRF